MPIYHLSPSGDVIDGKVVVHPNGATYNPGSGNVSIIRSGEFPLYYTVLESRYKLGSWASTGGGNVSESILAGPLADLPAAGTEGRLYLPEDAPYLYRDDGISWTPFGSLSSLVEPVNGDFTWVNQGSATVSTASGGVLLTVPAQSSDNWRMRVKDAPATPYTITALMAVSADSDPAATWYAGIIFRESSSGEFTTLGLDFYHASGLNVGVSRFTNSTTWAADPYLEMIEHAGLTASALWLRMTDNGTNRIYYVSPNGHTWQQVYSVSRTDEFTADQVGFGINSTTNKVNTLHLLSWKEE